MNLASTTVHATSVALAVDHDGPLCGLALLGPSGVGKSTLAAQLLSSCTYGRTRLIADDMTQLSEIQGALFASAPPILDSTLEIRGTGIARTPSSSPTRLRVAFDLSASAERQPEPLAPWQPLQQSPLKVPQYRWHGPSHAIILFLRAVFSGHSAQGGFESISAEVE